MSGRQLLDSVADAVAAGEAVDWHDVERVGAQTRDADLIRQLKIIAGIGATRRTHAPRGPTWWSRTVETGVAVVLTICCCAARAGDPGRSRRARPGRWPHIVNVLIFGVGGLVLLAGGGRDRRLPLVGRLVPLHQLRFRALVDAAAWSRPRRLTWQHCSSASSRRRSWL